MPAELDEQKEALELLAHRESLATRFFRFVRALIVGSGATIVDFSVLTPCIRVFGRAPTIFRLPAVLAGASVQFFGSRTSTFRASAARIGGHAKLFLCADATTLAPARSVPSAPAPLGGR